MIKAQRRELSILFWRYDNYKNLHSSSQDAHLILKKKKFHQPSECDGFSQYTDKRQSIFFDITNSDR